MTTSHDPRALLLRQPSTYHSFIRYPKTIAGGDQGSPNGQIHGAPDRRFEATHNRLCQPARTANIAFSTATSFPGNVNWPATTTLTHSSTTTIGSMATASSSAPWTYISRPRTPNGSLYAGPTKIGHDDGTEK